MFCEPNISFQIDWQGSIYFEAFLFDPYPTSAPSEPHTISSEGIASSHRQLSARRNTASMSADEAGDPTPVSNMNGEPRQDPTAIAGSGKRKRSTQDNGLATDANDTASRSRANLHETLRNLIELLLK